MTETGPIILASTSPQRRTLLQRLNVPFTVVAPRLKEERLEEGCSLPDALARLALAKTISVASLYNDALIIGCDTVVVLDNRILGKPHDAAEAQEMLCALSGRAHEVMSGLAIMDVKSGRSLCRCAETTVFMRNFSQKEAEQYIKTGESIGRAGSYAIQERGVFLTKGISGSWTNVVGLPLELLSELLREFGKDPFAYVE